jgi:PAS domain S-box-containing protein
MTRVTRRGKDKAGMGDQAPKATMCKKRKLTKNERDQFFSLSLDMLCIASADGYFKWLNPAFTETLGWAVDELLARPYTEYIHPDDLAATIREVQRQVAAGEKVFNFENRYRHKDGSWRSLSWKSASRGELMYAVARDVTENNRLVEALRLSEERSRDFTEVASHFQWESDEEFRILHHSEDYARVSVRERNEIIGRTLWQIVGVNDSDEDKHWGEFRRQLMAHEPVRNFRYEITNKEGRKLYRALNGKPVFSLDGRFKGYRCATRDETTEVEARQQIVMAEKKRDEFRTLLEATSDASPDGILVADATGRYLFWNNRFSEMWGLSQAYLQSRSSPLTAAGTNLDTFADQIADDPSRYLDEIARIYDPNESPKATFADLSLKDGRVFVRYAARISAGKLPYAILAWIFRDVTEQRKLDAALAQTQRLNTVGELSGGIAHELNNLLMIIGGNIELILEHHAESQTGKFAQAACLAVERSAELIRHLLAFSRRLPLAPKLTDVNALIGETMKILPGLLGESVSTKFVPGSELWHTIVDTGSLQSALESLATNARYAMPAGGSLVIETSNQVLDAAYAEKFADVTVGEYIMISVTDSGTGMSSDNVKRAFEPFFTTKPVGKGTGLGLSVVYGFVKQSGGHVAIYSEEGRGTSVRIYLPRAPQESAPEVKSLAVPIATENKKSILLVEDSAPLMAIARAFLNDLGYHVLEASNGAEALEIVRSHKAIDLLFTDVVLPDGMDGAEVARAAERLRPGLKVLFASGYSREALVHQGCLDGGVSLLLKPYRKFDLAQAIRGCLSQNAFVEV